jgi:hypothetical protein
MITFRCTKKVRDLFGLRDRDLSEDTEGDLREWFIDAATIDRHRCLLFTHKVMLYSFWALAVRKPDLLRFEDLFRHHATAMLTADGFNPAEIERLLGTPGHRFGKTNSRPVTGSMNDHIWQSQHHFAQEGGIHMADVLAVNRFLNDTPMGALGPGQHMDFPINVLTRIIRPSGAA